MYNLPTEPGWYLCALEDGATEYCSFLEIIGETPFLAAKYHPFDGSCQALSGNTIKFFKPTLIGPKLDFTIRP